MKTVIGLSGYARAGKDTVAGLLWERGYKRLAFADALRNALYALNPTVLSTEGVVGVKPYSPVDLRSVIDEYGWDKAKTITPEVRDLLQRMGTEVGREQFGPHFWVDMAFKTINESEHDLWVLSDVRFPNEYNAVVDNDGFVFRINRPGCGPANNHVSETALDGHGWHAIIDNNGGLSDLRLHVEKVLKTLSIPTALPAVMTVVEG